MHLSMSVGITVFCADYQSFLWFDERPVDAVHLVIEAACVAQVVSRAVPAPQRSGHRAAVDALSSLRGHVVHHVWKKGGKEMIPRPNRPSQTTLALSMFGELDNDRPARKNVR